MKRSVNTPVPRSEMTALGNRPSPPASTDAMLDALQRDAFDYFLNETNPANGLVLDKTQPGAPASIAAVGFALAAYPVGVERSWMTRTDAIGRTLALLRFFWTSPHGTAPHATGYKGFYYHFLDMKTGERADRCELSTVDTSFLRDVAKLNNNQRNFRVFGPDETLSNGLEALFEMTKRQSDAATAPNDEFLAPTGRVMEMLSEHQCEGWIEGYLLTGRHGLFNCYEAFIHIVDSMFNQHAKWLKVTSHLPWRRKIASLNYLLTSHVWRHDHNGFTHKDPGFIDLVMNKKSEFVRVYLPPDASCLLSVMDHCLRSRHYVNVVIAGKHFGGIKARFTGVSIIRGALQTTVIGDLAAAAAFGIARWIS